MASSLSAGKGSSGKSGAGKKKGGDGKKKNKKAAGARKKKDAGKELVVVGQSAIHGKGLFANQKIKKGALIGIYDGPISKKDGPHVLWCIDDDTGEEYGVDGKNEMRYVNHSLEPNACFEERELYALRVIRPGEEITHHYGEGWKDVD